MEVYLVGGAVRDSLLGLPIRERDWVVVGVTPEQMIALGYQQVGKDFPVFLHPKTREEYALARKERKVGHGYTGFECDADVSVRLEEDLQRRDLTINAIAMDAEGRLIDPYGGQKDLAARILRHVSEAFVEDPVRVLRLGRFKARFAHLGFVVAPETVSLVSHMVRSHELDYLVPERVWQEFEKILQEPHPEEFFAFLRQTGALQVLFPELDALFGVPIQQTIPDAGTEMLGCLKLARETSDDPIFLFMVCLHDLGKILTLKSDWPYHPHHDTLAEQVIHQFCERLRVPRAYRLSAIMASRYHTQVAEDPRTLSPETILNVLTSLGALRQPLVLTQLINLVVIKNTYRGIHRPEVTLWSQCLEICLGVPVQSTIQGARSGQEIAKRLTEARCQRLGQVLSQLTVQE